MNSGLIIGEFKEVQQNRAGSLPVIYGVAVSDARLLPQRFR